MTKATLKTRPSDRRGAKPPGKLRLDRDTLTTSTLRFVRAGQNADPATGCDVWPFTV